MGRAGFTEEGLLIRFFFFLSTERKLLCPGDSSPVLVHFLVVKCGDPGKPRNGKQERVTNNYSYEGSVSFSCDANYTLVGKKIMFCQDDKNWSEEVPQCAGECRSDIM